MTARSFPVGTAADPPVAPDQLCLFDGLSPFFLDRQDGATNWSKIPFARLERDGLLDPAKADAVVQAFDRYIATMASLGYSAVAIDDLSHLVVHDFYPEPLRRKLRSYHDFYDRLFATIKAHDLKLLITTDYMFFHPSIEQHLRDGRQTAADLFRDTLRSAFAVFPQVDGIVLRIGESDGVDVEADFKSRLTIKRPTEARALLQRLLPLFDGLGKTLVFRTWTLGAYPIGDLMWNRRTYDAVFRDIASPNLIVSLKYGDADFFRYLEINPLFFHGPHRKIVELQCRREYEGMGEYPSFVGWVYAEYLAALRRRQSNLVGIYAVQAGGWAPFAKLAYCANGSLWNELNTYVTVNLFTDDAPLAEIVAAFCRAKGIEDVDRFLQLLTLSDEAIEEGLYVREFARQSLYFRRVRVPPLIWVFWHNVTAGGVVGRLYGHLVRDKAAAVAEGHRAVDTVRAMLRLAQELRLPDGDLRFQLDTFAILAVLREVLFSLDTPETHARLEVLLTDYRRRYPHGYRFDYAPRSPDRFRLPAALLFHLLIRHEMPYRRADHLLLNRHVTRLKALAVRLQQSKLPRFVDKQGMSVDALLR